MEQDRAFEALSEPVRRQVLDLLAEGEQTAGTIVAGVQAKTDISQPAVSQHLKVLREAGLVTVRADGTRRLYAIDPAGIDAVQRWLARLTAPVDSFTQPLDALATEVARGQRSRRAAAADHPAQQPGRSRPA